jgi:hypothetical protein
MILAEIREYLQRRGRASLADIALHFDIDAGALRGMLDVWMRKGKVRRQLATASCGSSCCQCQAAATEIYFWVDTPTDTRGAMPPVCPHG